MRPGFLLGEVGNGLRRNSSMFVSVVLVTMVSLFFLGIGLLGGFTTFSTVSVETVLLAQRGRRDWAWVNLLGTLAVAVVAAGIGIMLGGLLPR